MGSLIVDDFDKFENRRIRTLKNEIPFIWGGARQVYLNLQYTEHGDRADLDVRAMVRTGNWWYIRTGNLVFHVDGQGMTLDPNEHDERTHYDSIQKQVVTYETVFYTLTKDQLRQICDAPSEIEFQISGSGGKVSYALGKRGQMAFRQFYNQVFDETAYPESLNAACFPANALLYTANGYAAIGDLDVGDGILSWHKGCSRLVPRVVTSKREFGLAVTLDIYVGGLPGPICTTAHHSFLTGAGWKRAGRLRDGEVLVHVTPQGLASRKFVESVVCRRDPESVFNVHTAGEHNFVVGGIVAHNFTVLRGLRTILHRAFIDPFIGARSFSVGDSRRYSWRGAL